MNLNTQQFDYVDRLRKEGYSWSHIGNLLGRDRRTVSKAYKAASERIELSKALEGLYENLELEKPRYETLMDTAMPERFKPIEVTGDVIATCDWHIPLHDPVMVNHVIDIAEKKDIRKLIIGGDFLHMETFSHYPPYQPEAAFEIERREGNAVLNTLLRHFDEVVLFWGNHEHRISRALDFKISFEQLIKWMLDGVDDLDRVKISELDYALIHHGGRTVRFSHQTNFSKVPLSVPRQMAMKYDCSSLTAHSHHLAFGFAINGYDWIMEGGGLFDPKRTQYIQRTNLHHFWVPGFTVFQNGAPVQYSPRLNNL